MVLGSHSGSGSCTCFVLFLVFLLFVAFARSVQSNIGQWGYAITSRSRTERILDAGTCFTSLSLAMSHRTRDRHCFWVRTALLHCAFFFLFVCLFVCLLVCLFVWLVGWLVGLSVVFALVLQVPCFARVPARTLVEYWKSI